MSIKGRKGFEMKQYLDKFGREITEIGKMKYQLKSLNESSAKFGACEICNKHVSEVFLQAKLEEYKPGSYMDKGTQFGHKQCLLNQRIGE